MTLMKRMSRHWQIIARLMAILPELDSIITEPRPIRPSFHASWSIRRAGRSFALPPGFSSSSLPYTVSRLSRNKRLSLTSGVLPMVERKPSVNTLGSGGVAAS
ncbi:hypothetical protein D3C75_674620 [compost metagenome]